MISNKLLINLCFFSQRNVITMYFSNSFQLDVVFEKIFFRSLLYLCLHDKMLKINKTKTWKAEISHLFIDIQVYQLYICI